MLLGALSVVVVIEIIAATANRAQAAEDQLNNSRTAFGKPWDGRRALDPVCAIIGSCADLTGTPVPRA